MRARVEKRSVLGWNKSYVLTKKENRACDNGENNSDCKIYASMAKMSSNDEWKNHGKTEN